MELHDGASPSLIMLLYTTFIVLCRLMQTIQSDESMLSSSSKGTTESSTGLDHLVTFEPSSNSIFTNSDVSDISAGVLSISVDYSSNLSNDYETTGSKSLDTNPSYFGTMESVYGIESPIYSLTWIPMYSSALFAGSTDANHLTLAFESSFIPSSIVITISSFVTSSFVHSMDVSVLKHQSFDSNFETTSLDNNSPHLEASSFIKSFNIDNAGEVYSTNSIDALVIYTETTDTLKSSFATSATSYSLPVSTGLLVDNLSSLYINITDEIQRTYLHVSVDSLNLNTIYNTKESLIVQSSVWIQPTRTQITQVETESLDSVLSISNSRSGFVTSFIADEDQISHNVQSSSPVLSVNVDVDTSSIEDVLLPALVDGSFQTTEGMYTTGMMDDYLTMETNTVVTSLYYSVTDVPLHSDLLNGELFSNVYHHVSTTSSIHPSFDTPAVHDLSRSDYVSFTTDYSDQNVSGGMFHTSPVSTSDTDPEYGLATYMYSGTTLSATSTNSTPSRKSFNDARVEETSTVIGPTFTKSSMNTHAVYKSSVDNDQIWNVQDIASNSQNEVSAGTQLELFIVIGAIAGFAVVVFVCVLLICLCKQCCSTNPQSVGVKVPLKTTLTTRVVAAKKTVTMTHFVKVAPMQVMTKRKVYMDA
ncbi:hypothetical protein ACJMK2_037000 [Sinanodonta woodiana]|uniref:Uncharacterized protein n=1 Tax=Sinanodonta woodiana TaxID=1069815 RepID=A0ABD3WME7_SINWO